MEKYKKIDIEKIIKNSNSKKECLENMGIKSQSYDTLNRYIKKFNLDISHFNKEKNINELLTKNSNHSIGNIKRRLIRENILKEECSKCGQSNIWFGEKISLILDHKNGVNNDNRLENLRLLCPNCNATLDTHCGKNRRHQEIEIKDEDILNVIEECSSIRQIILKLNLYKSANLYKKIQTIIQSNGWWGKLRKNTYENQKHQTSPNIKDKDDQINKILEANIDFSKKNWGPKVAEILNCSPQYALKFVKNNIPYIGKEN